MRNLTRAVFTLVAVCLVGLAGCAHHPRAASTEPAADTATSLRVISYNIHHAEGDDRRVDLARIARVITENHAELAAIQEVDVRTKRVPLDEAAELARLTGMHVTFGKAIDYQGGAYGQVILSRFPISDPHVYKLPSRPDKEQRIALAVTVSPGGGRPEFRFVSTHLDHQSDADRTAQADELVRVLFPAGRDAEMPTILAGDFNATPNSAPLQAILARFANAGAPNQWDPTIPAHHPREKIDYILVSKGGPWVTKSTAVIDEEHASDHRPVVAELQWVTQGRP